MPPVSADPSGLFLCIQLAFDRGVNRQNKQGGTTESDFVPDGRSFYFNGIEIMAENLVQKWFL